MKKLIAPIALMLLFATPTQATVEYDDLIMPKPPAYRVGTSDEIEKEYKFTDKTVKTKYVKQADKEISTENITYADLSIKKISHEVGQMLAVDENDMVGDLSLLWQGAAVKSDTLKFALYKLSNPDADKPDEKAIKKVVGTIANMSTLLGAGIGNPLLASGAFMSSSILGIMGQDNKALNYKYTKVNDADMIILVRKVEDLQQNLVNKYFEYMTARKNYELTTKMVKERYSNYTLAQNSTREVIVITDAYYREAIDLNTRAKNTFLAARASLEQLVGNDIFKQFEEAVRDRQ